MKKYLYIYVLPFSTCLTASLLIDTLGCNSSTRTYIDLIRTPSISGLLTLGSFILSLNVFIIINLKEKLYDSKFYYDNFNKQSNLGDTKLEYYVGLTRLGRLLTSCVPTILLAAIINLFVGPIKHPISTGISIGATVASFSLILFCWWQIRGNLFRWFEYLDSENGPSPPPK